MSDGSFNPVQQPDVGQTMNNILGLQQKRQALQTGQYTQQSADAKAQTDTRAAQEQARVAAYLSNPANKGKKADDVSDDITSLAPTTGQDYIAKMRQNEDTQQKVLSAKNKVNSEVRTQVANGIRGIDDTDDATSVAKRFDTMEAMNPQSKAILDPLRERLQHLPPPGTPGRREGIASVAQMIDGNSGETPGIRDQGTSAKPINTNALGIPIATGPAYDKSQIGTAGTGQAAVINQHGVTPIAGQANTTSAQQIATKGSASGVTDRVQQAQAAANNTTGAQDALNRAKAILESDKGPNTGGNFESVKQLKNLMSGLGVDTQGADDMNTLTKNLARYEAARATQSGLGGTDAARELAHAGSPNTSLDNKALLGVVRQSLATEKANALYANIQSKHSSDPDALSKNEADYRNIPHLIEAHEYGMMRTPQEADEYLQKHNLTKADMKDAWSRVKEFGSR